ncbi:MAG: DUF1501 domain-containing protein [Gemmataceae bacterium]|nr:DUF1501 domain-containing protein [Gemmataceae bacterium]
MKTDEQLVAEYRTSRCPQVFAEIVARHAAMVLRSCMRQVGNVHEAEDVVQAVFLVLAQRPEAVDRSLSGWLHEVARRTACKVVRGRVRRPWSGAWRSPPMEGHWRPPAPTVPRKCGARLPTRKLRPPPRWLDPRVSRTSPRPTSQRGITMLSILGSGTKRCDGTTRREMLRAGSLSLFAGMTLPRFLHAASVGDARRRGTAKSVILFNLLGGPSHQDMFDLKPEAPPEIRGEFRPIQTSAPGLHICEHLPRAARWMHRASLIRTVTHTYNAHNPLALMTGFTGGENGQLYTKNTDPPDIGAVCQYLGMGPRDLPGAVCMPCAPGTHEEGSFRRPGPYGGYLGSQYDPLFTACKPTFARQPRVPHYDPVPPIGDPYMPSLQALPDMTATRMDDRRSLVKQLDQQLRAAESSPAMNRLDRFQQRAYSLLSSSKTRDAFDLSREPDRVRDRYGRNVSGASLLTARRLVEAGVPFVSVHAEIFGSMGLSYDMHENNFGMLKDVNLPILDLGYSALVQDLEERGLLDFVLVVVMGEMGRSPRINGKAGREHWPQCGFSLLTGGGVKPGTVFGTTDKIAAYPKDHPVSPGDVVATIYHLLGIDPHMMVPDLAGRPIPIAHGGDPIRGVIA